MLKIHETTGADGSLASTVLRVHRNVVTIAFESEELPLPPGAIAAVMKRFGKPLEPTERLVYVASLELGDGGCLRHVRHLATYDVIARDWLVYEAGHDAAPACALATTVAGALHHLARAARALR